MYISENHKKQGDFKMTDYAPGMRAVIRDEEWLIKRIETNSLGHQVLHCVGVTPLVKDRDAIFSHRSRTDSDCRSCEHSVDCRLIPIFQTVTIVFRKSMAAAASH